MRPQRNRKKNHLKQAQYLLTEKKKLSTHFFLPTKEGYETENQNPRYSNSNPNIATKTNVSIFLFYSQWSWIFHSQCASIRCRYATSLFTSKRRYSSNLSDFTFIVFEIEKQINTSFVLCSKRRKWKILGILMFCNFDGVVSICGWVEIRDCVYSFQTEKKIMAKGMFIFRP